MVPGQTFFQMDLQSSSGSRSRSLCNRMQPQTTLCCSQPGPSSSLHRCNVHRLEQVEKDLPLSPSKPVTETPSQAQGIQGSDSPSGSQLAEEQLVSTSSKALVLANSQPKTDANSTNSDCVSFLKNSECPGFVDFMKFAAQKDANIDPINTLFLESDKRESTLRQYDSAVKKLALFLKESEATVMTTNLAISFFRSLFEKGLASSTITTAKSALKKIFLHGFKINLTDSYFSSIPKACARLRPVTRPHTVSWFLNDVLKLDSEIDNQDCSFTNLLRKTLFLISLASGARISELSALSREPNHIDFLPSGEVLLAPHPKFLAKNEDPRDRWSPGRSSPSHRTCLYTQSLP
ncbi:uncharacterized protein [Macrobrachium rosenbergii]|uniref:uncharacterized protein n=1 Tax=Macrobrachium rosenbergii TaxID=79674 RepID=UPI0034D3FC72